MVECRIFRPLGGQIIAETAGYMEKNSCTLWAAQNGVTSDVGFASPLVKQMVPPLNKTKELIGIKCLTGIETTLVFYI